jgi:apolipoprotein N-acyltransferase
VTRGIPDGAGATSTAPSWRWRLAPPISGLLLWLAFAPASIVPLAFVALVPFALYLARDDTRWGRLLAAFAGGMLFHVAGFFWIRHVTALGMLLLAAYASLYWAAFALLVPARGDPASSPAWPFRLAAVWTVLEYVRGTALTGIPWLLAGHALADFPALAQTADLAGVAGATFLLVLVNASLAQVWIRPPATRFRTAAPAATALLLLAATAYGTWRIRDIDAVTSNGPEVLLVQGNVEQSVKKAGLHWRKIHAIYANLTREACGRGGLPDLVVWPETMHPAVPTAMAVPGVNDPLAFRRIAAAPALIGVLLYEPDAAGGARKWNSAVALDARGRVTGRYDKVHLVPVGEYFPLKNWWLWERLVQRFTNLSHAPDLESGTSLDPVFCAGWSLGALVCYESAFAYIARAQVGRGAQVLVNLSNEAWYRDSAELDQMLAMSRFRCIETRTGMARATNSGISAIIDPTGRVTATVHDTTGRRKEVAGVLRGRIPVGPRRSLYLAMGEWLVVLLALAALLDLSGRVLRGRRGIPPDRPPPDAPSGGKAIPFS